MRVGFIRTFELDNEVLWFFAVPAGSLVYFSSLVLLDREYDVASYVFGRVLVLFFSLGSKSEVGWQFLCSRRVPQRLKQCCTPTSTRGLAEKDQCRPWRRRSPGLALGSLLWLACRGAVALPFVVAAAFVCFRFVGSILYICRL